MNAVQHALEQMDLAIMLHNDFDKARALATQVSERQIVDYYRDHYEHYEAVQIARELKDIDP